MQLSKNKKYQYLFFFILSIYTIFNGGNSNVLIQINFILISLLFLFCLKDKNYLSHFKFFLKKNKLSIIFYILFLLYLLFQIIPLQVEYLKFFSPSKYKYISMLGNITTYSSISLSPSNTYFQLLNFFSFLILVFILKMIFYSNRHKNRLYLFFSLAGFVSALFAILIYLNGNPDFLIFKNSFYIKSSTGFFSNRTVFALYLLFCLIASLEYLKDIDENKFIKSKDNFYIKIYIRLFVIFITIGIITSFSRIGNFLLLITMLFYVISEFFFKDKKNKSFRNMILLIIIFDVVILAYFFGSTQLFERFFFLKHEFTEIYSTEINLSRFQIVKFAFNQLNEFKLFGYGAGSFENLFKINFNNLDNLYANHAHSDIVEFIGEFGFVGLFLLLISLFSYFYNGGINNFVNSILVFYLITLLIFDFSLHIPLIQICFLLFFTLNKKIIQLN